jgi:DNA-binding response OmpR family regulator
MRVLVVEDHAKLAERIAQGMRQAGIAVDTVYDGAAALKVCSYTEYDVIVLDRDLPIVHGDRVCHELAGSGPRILMLTAAGDVEDRIDGLELGADDYLPKPFEFAELIARLRALCRRAPSSPPILCRGDLTVDRARHRARRGDDQLPLTRKEFGVLEMLLAADGALVSAEELIDHVWDSHLDPSSNIVSVTMTRLRRKLGDPPLIETVIGKGFRMRSHRYHGQLYLGCATQSPRSGPDSLCFRTNQLLGTVQFGIVKHQSQQCTSFEMQLSAQSARCATAASPHAVASADLLSRDTHRGPRPRRDPRLGDLWAFTAPDPTDHGRSPRRI